MFTAVLWPPEYFRFLRDLILRLNIILKHVFELREAVLDVNTTPSAQSAQRRKILPLSCGFLLKRENKCS